MINFKTILETIPTLDPSQLQKLKGSVTALLSLNGGNGKSEKSTYQAPWGDDGDFQLALEVIHDELTGLGISTSTYSKPKVPYRSKIYGAWQFLDERIPDLRRVERRALFHTCIRCLIRMLKKQGLPITEIMVLKHLHRLPQALEEGFPGYLEAGMLSKVVRREFEHVWTEPDRQTIS